MISEDKKMKAFCFTIDDNIRFLKEIAALRPQSLFDHPYTAMLRRLHDRFGLKIQLNLFYQLGDFTLADMTAGYAEEFAANADWLKLSFHSREENPSPYEHSGYAEVYGDAEAVHREILRFASPASLAATTTVHYCRTTQDGVRALSDLGVRGLLGLFGTDAEPRISYSLDDSIGAKIRRGRTVTVGNMAYAALDLVVNNFTSEAVLTALSPLLGRPEIHVMIHEQYFYGDYRRYQPDFEQKLAAVFSALAEQGYESLFLEEMI